jgi:hypothetical protein
MLLQPRPPVPFTWYPQDAFTPLALQPAVWLDAADPATLFQNNTFTTPAVSTGDPIGGWQDKSGNANHCTASGSARPTLRLAEQNGLPAIRGDDSNDRMAFSGTALSLFRNIAYAYVFVAYNARQTGTDREIFFAANANGSEVARAWLEEGAQANRYRLLSRRVNGDALTTLTTDTNHGSSAKILTGAFLWGSNACWLRQNGVEVAAGTYASGAGATSNTDSFAFTLFATDASGAPVGGQFHELVVVLPSSPLSLTAVGMMEAYLNRKWAIFQE